jgi:uncharacterized protein YrrD
LRKGAAVYSSDGEELGKVADVVADEQKDIFSGLVLNPGLFKGDRFVPADLVDVITEQGVTIDVPAAEADERLPDAG